MSKKGNQNAAKPAEKKRARQNIFLTSAAEYEIIAAAAQKAGLSFSSFVRAAVLKAAQGEK
ncbi:MAG: hypothetical protein LBU73_09405 [Helicobacteraceae bacterium]|jgi:uncharacterized protein (DUF1778 family)|nr:hypothetical protein [Helicobacteraceae bacterium]